MTDDNPLNLYPPETELLSELHEVVCSPLSVVVDFNQLYDFKGDEAYEIIAKLRDLLR